MPNLLWQDMSLVQTDPAAAPETIVAAATIRPTCPMIILSGTTAIATIVPPVTGLHVLAIVAGTTEAAYTTSGNIVGLTTASTTQPSLFVYRPDTGKYVRTVA